MKINLSEDSLVGDDDDDIIQAGESASLTGSTAQKSSIAKKSITGGIKLRRKTTTASIISAVSDVKDIREMQEAIEVILGYTIMKCFRILILTYYFRKMLLNLLQCRKFSR